MIEWKLVYHILGISKTCSNITRSILAETCNNNEQWIAKQEHEQVLRGSETIIRFFYERGNPYKVFGPKELHNFISNQVVPRNKSCWILPFWGNGSKNYMIFFEVFLKKGKKVCWHYKANQSATIFAKNQKDLTKNVMLQIHPWYH